MNMKLSAKILALSILLLSFGQANADIKHVAKKGETFLTIASEYGVSQTELVNANPQALDKVFVKQGDVLIIPDKTKKYLAKSGDSLTSIAKKEGITVQQLAKANNLPVTSQISIGQSLNIPSVASSNQSTDTQSTSDNLENKKYRVQVGDNLTVIAKNHKVPIKLLAQVNDMNLYSDLPFGKLLVIPTQQQVNDYLNKNNTTTNTKVESNQNSGNTTKSSNNKRQEYTVKRGDTLLGVAKKFDVDFVDLAAFNGLNYYDHLLTGQKLDIPPKKLEANAN